MWRGEDRVGEQRGHSIQASGQYARGSDQPLSVQSCWSLAGPLVAVGWSDAARRRVATTPECTVLSAKAIGGDSGRGVATVVDQTISPNPVHEFVDWRDRGGETEREGVGSGKKKEGGGRNSHGRVKSWKGGRRVITTSRRP